MRRGPTRAACKCGGREDLLALCHAAHAALTARAKRSRARWRLARAEVGPRHIEPTGLTSVLRSLQAVSAGICDTLGRERGTRMVRHAQGSRCRVRFVAAALVVACSAIPTAGHGQAPSQARSWMDRVRLQVGADANLTIGVSAHLAFAPMPRLLLGGQGGYGFGEAWPIFTSFKRPKLIDVWSWGLFARVIASENIHFDAGFAWMTFGTQDDVPCDDPSNAASECGKFLGGYAQVMLGYRWIYWAPRIRAGAVSSDATGSSFEWIFSPFVARFMWSMLDD